MGLYGKSIARSLIIKEIKTPSWHRVVYTYYVPRDARKTMQSALPLAAAKCIGVSAVEYALSVHWSKLAPKPAIICNVTKMSYVIKVHVRRLYTLLKLVIDLAVTIFSKIQKLPTQYFQVANSIY